MKNKTYVIAEMACSHDGSVDHAKKIIDGAGEAVSDAIQLQVWALKHMMAPSHPKYDLCQQLEFTQDQWRDLVMYSRKKYPRMHIYSFIYEHNSIDFAESLNLDGYKLSSADLSNPYMLDCIAETGKTINLSVGASTMDEIENAILRIRKKSSADIILMHGIQSFPTKIQDIHLNFMKTLKERFNLLVGYQDHCDASTASAFWIPALALGMGAAVMEKHLTYDRSCKGIDYESALNPDEFKDFVTMVRQLDDAKGSDEERPFSDAEKEYRKFQKKSIVADHDLKAGAVLKKTDISFLRCDELGITPDQYESFIGKTIKKDIPALQRIMQDDLV